MSLIGFHRVLIIVAVAFCLAFAGWELKAYQEGGGTAAILLATVFALLAAGLTVYLARLRSILRIRD